LKSSEDLAVVLRHCRFIPAILMAAHMVAPHLRAAENLQLFLNQIMPGKQGAAVVSNPKTGRILAIWNTQTALQEAFPPGSTAKVVASAAALEERVITPTERIQCRRVPRLLGEAYHCSHPPASHPCDLADALANSCNYFFSELSTRLSSSVLAHWYAAFGFGAAGEDTLPGEVHVRDNAREKALAVLGQQGVSATPAQVFLAYSAIAMHGEVFRLIAPGQNQAPSIDRVVSLRKETIAALAAGLRECVVSGIGRGAAVEGVEVAGKTGTAPALDGSRSTHAWFVGYAPVAAPEVALVVFLKRGSAAANAAPLAGRIFKEYFALKSHPQ
jgi:cell division protein FtsI/penicillin-binding protein 2